MGGPQAEIANPAVKGNVADRRFRLASPTTAILLAALTLAFVVFYVPLAYPARDFGDGVQILVAFLALSIPGVVVACRQPANPIGWILLGLGLQGAVVADLGRRGRPTDQDRKPLGRL